MKCRLLIPVLLSTLLPAGYAQTQLGQPTLDEQKAQIWCAAVRFVYDDTGRPNLKNKLKCGSSLKQFESSIKADSQKVYSLLYQPLEGRGVMYKGLGSDKSRLQKLTTEIINKLKASPTRKASPARMQAVDALAVSLNSYVNNGTPPGDVSSQLNEAATTDTSTDEATAAAPADAGPEDNPNYAPPAPAGNKEGIMSSLFAPIAFIVSLLSLVLFWLLRRGIKDLAIQLDRYRKELEEVKTGGQNASTAPGGTFSSKRMTPELRAEVERLVQQHVAEELGRVNEVGNSAAAVTEALGYGASLETASPVPTQAQAALQPAPAANQNTAALVTNVPVAPTLSAAPVAAGAPAAPAPPVTPALDNTASTPVAYSLPTVSHLATPTPAGSASASMRDEFDSLVPPVQLPAPEPYTTVGGKISPAAPTIAYYYVKEPANGEFNLRDLQEEPQPDSIYEIAIDPQQPDTATFQVNPDPAMHDYAIQNAQNLLHDACHYQPPSESVSYIINDKPGTLRRVGDIWQIGQKAVIYFE